MSATEKRADDAVISLFGLPNVDYDRVIESNQRAMRAAFEAQGHGLRNMARIGGSVLDFVQRRIRHDVETAQALGACRTPSDAYLVCHDFVDTAIDDYAAEFGVLATMYAEHGREALHDVEHEIDEVARPVLKAVLGSERL